ncbi:TPA: DUF916 and DUF3324 domain-containing protein [Enterococcus faecium]
MTEKSWADEISEITPAFNFSVSPIFTKNQIDNNLSYFYIYSPPDSSEQLDLKLISHISSDQVINIHINDATTNEQVMIDYGVSNFIPDESLKQRLSDLLSINEELATITLKGYEEKIVSLKLNTPKAPFEGIKLGAIQILGESLNSDNKNLSNQFGYTIGVMLTQDRSDYFVGGDLVLKKTKSGISNGEPVIQIEFQNPNPKLINDLTLEAELRKKNDKAPIMTKKNHGLSVAPNSNFTYTVDLDSEKVVYDNYDLYIKAYNKEKNWEWIEAIDLSKDKNKVLKIREQIISSNAWKLIFSLIFIFFVGIGYVLVKRK